MTAGNPLLGFFTNSTVLTLIGTSLLGSYLFGGSSVKNLTMPQRQTRQNRNTNYTPEQAVEHTQNIINDTDFNAVNKIIRQIDSINNYLEVMKEEMDDTGKNNLVNLINNFNQTKTFFEGMKSTVIDLSNKEDHNKLRSISENVKTMCQKWISILPRLIVEFTKLGHGDDIGEELETYETLLQNTVAAIEVVK